MKANGSIQNISEIPDDLKEMYKTIWEIKQKSVIDMARGGLPLLTRGKA